MGEDPADHPRILDGRDQAHAAAAARAGQDIHVEGAPHEVSPGPVAGWGGRLALELRDGGRGGVSHGCSQRKARLLIGDGAEAPASMGGKDAVVHHEIGSRAGSQGGELFQEFQGLEEQVAGAIVPGALELRIVRSKALFCIVPRWTE